MSAEKSLQKIKRWLDGSLLSLNIDKTKIITFSLSTRSLPDFQSIKIHDSSCNLDIQCNCDKMVQRVPSLKYLGVYIDETFTWKDQIKYITNKIRKLIYKFYELNT